MRHRAARCWTGRHRTGSTSTASTVMRSVTLASQSPRQPTYSRPTPHGSRNTCSEWNSDPHGEWTPMLNRNDAAVAQWNRLLDALREAGEHVIAGPRAQLSPARDRAVRYLQRVLRGMLLTANEVDRPDFPVLVRLFQTYLPYGNPNPDCIFFPATVPPRHTYRISGKRGDARIVEVQVMDGHFV